MTTVLVLAILALIWAAVLLPPYIQNRRETRPGDSIATFRTQLAVLERATPAPASNLARLDLRRAGSARDVPPNPDHGSTRWPAVSVPVARRRAEVRRRRRHVFCSLLAAVCVTLVLAVGLGGAVWLLHLAVDGAFGAYVFGLASVQQRSSRPQNVRYLEPVAPLRQVPEPALVLQRSGS